MQLIFDILLCALIYSILGFPKHLDPNGDPKEYLYGWWGNLFILHFSLLVRTLGCLSLWIKGDNTLNILNIPLFWFEMVRAGGHKTDSLVGFVRILGRWIIDLTFAVDVELMETANDQS